MGLPQWPCCPQRAPRLVQLPWTGVWDWHRAQLRPWWGGITWLPPAPVLEPLVSPQLKEDHQKALLRREFELQSLNLQRRLEQKFWSREKNLLVQESQQFRQSFLLLFMKLKWFLKRWRQGKVVHSEGEDFLEVQWRGGHAVGRVPCASLPCPGLFGCPPPLARGCGSLYHPSHGVTHR